MSLPVLTNPQALWVVIPFLPIIFWLIYRRRSIFSLFLRLLAVILLALALAGPKHVTPPTAEGSVTILFDGSDSISPNGRDALRSALAPILSNKQLELNFRKFAGEVSSVTKLTGDNISPGLADNTSINPQSTDLARALNSVTPGESVVLLTDGVETKGSARDLVPRLQSKGIRIFPFIPEESAFENQGLELIQLDAPLVVNEGELIELRATVRNNSSNTRTNSTADYTRGKVSLSIDSREILSQILTVPPGEERLLIARAQAPDGGVRKFSAKLITADGNTAIAERHRWLTVKKRDRILLLSGSQEDSRVIVPLLTEVGFLVESIIAGETIPTDLSSSPVVVLNNISKKQLPGNFLSRLEEYTKGGGGVLIIGGERSFGLGDYIDTPLETISPVNFLPPMTTKKRLNVAVALVIDKSRSMAAMGKIDAARASALAAIQSMKDDDYVAVIGFDASPFAIIKPQLVSEVRAGAAGRIQNLVASGNTNLLPTLNYARAALRDIPASRKHLIILSDGEVPNAGPAYFEEVTRLGSEGVTVSAIALGADADGPFMQSLARYGKGIFYQTLTPNQLPEIFLQDIKTTTGEKSRPEESVSVVEGPNGLHSTTSFPTPDLLGHVETKIKPQATSELLVRHTDHSSPLLASWRYGAGHTIAYTSDINGRWSAQWLKWSGFTKFWREVVGSLLTSGGGKSSDRRSDFDLRYQVEGDQLKLVLSLFDESLLSSRPTVQGTISGVVDSQIQFKEERPGYFTGVVGGVSAGDYQLKLVYGSITLPEIEITLPGELFGERVGGGVNRALLTELANSTGGAVNPTPELLLDKASTTNSSPEAAGYGDEQPLASFLAGIAVLLLLTEAFIRELGGQQPFRQLLNRRNKSTG